MAQTPRTGVELLAQAVKNRRTQLGLAQGDLKSHGGPGVVVVGQIERGDGPTPQPLTLARLDTALDWPPGMAADILSGATPSLKVVPTSNGNPVIDAIEADPFLLPEAKQHFLNQYQLLLRVQDQGRAIPQEPERLPYVAHGKRTTPVDPEEEARIEAEVIDAAARNPNSPQNGRRRKPPSPRSKT